MIEHIGLAILLGLTFGAGVAVGLSVGIAVCIYVADRAVRWMERKGLLS